VVTRPGRIGADQSKLMKVLADRIHAKDVKLSAEERRRLYIWLDGNVPFYGTYDKEEQLAQKAGEGVSPPSVQ